MARDPSSSVVEVRESFSIEAAGIDPALAVSATEVDTSLQLGDTANLGRPVEVAGDAGPCLCTRTKCPSPTAAHS